MPDEAEAQATPEPTIQPEPANDGGQAPPPANDTQPEKAEKPKEPTGDEKRKQLEALASELGMTLEGVTVSVPERVQFRKERQEWNRGIQAKEAELAKSFDERIKAAEKEIELGRSIMSAHTAGDYDGLARALGAKDWNEVQERFMARLADPNHQRLVKLEREAQEREEREAKAREEREATEKTERQRAAQAEYMRGLSEQMSSSKDPVIAAFHDDPSFAHMIFRIQQDHWDGRAPISPEQALRLAPAGEKLAYFEYLKSSAERYRKAFPGEPPKPANDVTPPKPKGKTTPAPEPTTPTSNGTHDQKDWLKRSTAAIEEAMRREEEEKSEMLRRVRAQRS